VSDDDEKPTPPVPPTDTVEIREKRTGPRTLERERVDTCDCGGTIYEETIATGRTILAIWSALDFDSDRFRLSEEYEQTERRVRCDRCGWRYTF
jgi:hypothetical protein